MKIRMLIDVAGTFHGHTHGVERGDVVDVDDVFGARYCALHYCEPVADRKEERAVVAPKVEERAVEPEKKAATRPQPRPGA